MLNYERDPAIAAAGAAAEIAERLRLVETRANARITIGMARYQAGDRGGAGRAARGHRALPHATGCSR